MGREKQPNVQAEVVSAKIHAGPQLDPFCHGSYTQAVCGSWVPRDNLAFLRVAYSSINVLSNIDMILSYRPGPRRWSKRLTCKRCRRIQGLD